MSTTTSPSSQPTPRKPRGRVLWWLLPLLVVLALAGSLHYLLRTESGLRFALAQTERLTKGMVRVGKVSGRLLGEFDLREVRYAGSDGTTVSLVHLHARLAPRALLQRQLHLELVDIEGLVVTPGPSNGAPSTPTVLPVRLPLDVRIDALALDDFRLNASGQPEDSQPFRIAEARFAGQWLGDTISVQSLSTALDLTGPLQLQARARMAPQAIDFEAFKLEGPGSIEATGRLGFEAVASDLKLRFEGLRWPFVPVAKRAPLASEIAGELGFSGRFEDYRYTLAAKAMLDGRAAQLAAEGSGSLEAVQIDRFQLDHLPGDGRNLARNAKAAGERGVLRASGRVAWSPQLRADLQAELEHVDPSLFAPSIPGDLNGRLDTQTTMLGEQPEIRFTLDLARSALRGQPFTLQAEGSTDARRVQLQRFALEAGKGRVDATGELRWSPAVTANLDAKLVNLDPAVVAAGWPGSLNGSLVLSTANEAQAPILFKAQIADSTLRGYPLRLVAEGALAELQTLTLQQFLLSSGSSSLNLSGQLTPPFDASGRFASPDLGALYPGLSGKAGFDFKLTGDLEQPHLLSHGEGALIRLGEQRLRALNWNADLEPGTDSTLTASISDAELGLHVDSIRLKLSGKEVWHRLELATDTERGKASLAVQGGFDRKRLEWGGELAALDLAPNGAATWALAKGAGLLLGRQRRSLESSCLQGSDGRACFTLEQNVLSDGTRVAWNIERLGLSAFQLFLPPQSRLSGSIDGDGHVNFTGGDVADAIVALNLRDAKLEVPDAPALQLDTGTLRADQTAGRLHGTVELRAPQGLLSADVAAAPGDAFNERALSGHLRADFPNLAFLEPLLPQLRALEGRLNGDIEVSGTPKRPRFAGAVQLADGHARLVVAGIELREVNLSLQAQREGPMSLDGRMKSGDGTMHLAGTIDPFATPLLADIALDGENFQVMNTAQARAWVTPKLHLVRDAKGATLTGELNVPRADITPKGFGGGGVDVSSDQVLVGVEAPPPPQTLPVYADLRLVLGNRVQIEGFGLKTRIEGAVNVTQEPRRGALGRGELRLVDGQYKAYGQDLTIENGSLLFTGGPVTTPAVDIYATRKPREDITVGVRVRGTLAKPELTLQSSPTLPREQQLSWLVLGRSLETSSTQDRSLVSSAALSLGLGGGDYLAGLIGKRVGLDELSVGGTVGNGSEVAANAQSIAGAQSTAGVADASAQAAQLTLGKYLTPRLFVSYGISLFQQGYTFRMLYTLGHGFKLSTETGTTSGGDILFQTDRGQRKPADGAPKPP